MATKKKSKKAAAKRATKSLRKAQAKTEKKFPVFKTAADFVKALNKGKLPGKLKATQAAVGVQVFVEVSEKEAAKYFPMAEDVAQHTVYEGSAADLSLALLKGRCKIV